MLALKSSQTFPGGGACINVAAMFKSFDHNISPPFHKDAALLKMDRIDVSPAGKGGGQRADEAFFDIKPSPSVKKTPATVRCEPY